jgi:hypothetical protein
MRPPGGLALEAFAPTGILVRYGRSRAPEKRGVLSERRRRPRRLPERPGELAAQGDAKLAEQLANVVVDGVGTLSWWTSR